MSSATHLLAKKMLFDMKRLKRWQLCASIVAGSLATYQLGINISKHTMK